MSNPDAADDKKLLRARLSEERKAHSRDGSVRPKLADQLRTLVAETGAHTVAAYLPFGTEPDIGGFVESAAANGVRLIMPVSNTDGTLNWVVFDGSMSPGIFGFNEPTGEPARLESADLILLPASAADLGGTRLGKGKGFYDRALGQLQGSVKCAAVVYESEVLEKVPSEAHDQPVDFVVTPERIIAVGSAA
ncbi:MAG: 5-formyltetrahydrofolate cyclo-ligase [Micrococcales bacterium]